MSLLDKLKADFEARRTKVVVLGEEVYVTPMTPGDEMRINALHPDDGALRMAELLVSKCRDAEGKPVFTKDDKQDLKRAVAGDRLGPLFAAIRGPAVEDQVKN
jgi:hypothetical protein